MDDDSPVTKRRRKASLEDDEAEDDEPPPFVYKGQPEKEIPKSITCVIFDQFVGEIRDWAFTECTLLQSIDIPATVKTIGGEAFSGCDSLIHVRLQTGLRSIGRSAFFQCRALIAIELNHGLECIEGGAFEECESLRTLSIPSTVETIGDDAFQDCVSLSNVTFHNECRMRSIGRRAFARCEMLQHIVLPRGLKAIHVCCFSRCVGLKTVSIPDTVETIDAAAFDGCRGLVDVNLCQGLTSIGPIAFARCISLSAIYLPSTIAVVKVHAFRGCTSLLGVEFPTEIPWETIFTIDQGSFEGCTSLINVSIPDAHPDDDDMSKDAFSGCKLLAGEVSHYGDEEIDNTASLRERFANLPVHNACYNASRNGNDTLTQITNTCVLEIDHMQDSFGLSPFHVVATSASLREDVFECLLDRYPVEVLWHRDKYGKTATDYLLAHTSEKAASLIQMALRRSVIETLSPRGLPKWRTELEHRSSLLPIDNDVAARSAHLYGIFQYLGYCIGVETTSLTEQALWKMRMNLELREDDSDSDPTCRENNRLQCGSDIVIENVIKYFWNDDSITDTALSTFPLCGKNWK